MKKFDVEKIGWSFSCSGKTVPVGTLTLEELQQALCECIQTLIKLKSLQIQQNQLLREYHVG